MLTKISNCNPFYKETPLHVQVNKRDLVPLKDGDIIQQGDVIMNDFNNPEFVVGPNHPRIGTTYQEYVDYIVCRIKKEESPM